MTQKQLSATSQQSQAWLEARRRLLRLLERLGWTVNLCGDLLSDAERKRLFRLAQRVFEALKRVDHRLKQHALVVKTASGLPCPRCRERAVSVTLKRGVIHAGQATCGFCGLDVRVACLGGVPFAQCPQCRYIATLAQGKREGGAPFLAFSCDKCRWVASDAYMTVAGHLLR